MPSWKRAHPNRFIVHNGEINTIKGNANNMLCREENMQTDVVDTSKDISKLLMSMVPIQLC